jgi:hypothetical protein
LSESFIGLRQRNRPQAWAEFKRAAAWWPALPLLPAFYPYAMRVVLRVILGESFYGRLPRRKAATAGDSPETSDVHRELVEVCRPENGAEAHMCKAALEAAGISARITGESVAALEPNLYWAAPRVLVAPAHAEEAARILRELANKRAVRPTPGTAS